MKNSTKIITGIVIAGVVAALVLPRFLKPEVVLDPVPAPTVEVDTPKMGDIHIYTSLTGNVEPSDVVYISPKMAGEVTEVFVKAGDTVTEGQILCKIDTKQVESAKLSLDSASISLADAKTTLQRMQVLYASGDISVQNFEQAQNGVKMAQLQYDGAKLAYNTQLEYSSIPAPIGGLVETFDISVHDMVSQQNLICVISGEGNKAVTFYATERISKSITMGDTVTIEKSGMEYNGTITEISSMVDAATGMFKLKASVEGGDGLATGTAVKLNVLSSKAENTIVLPSDAIYYDGGDAFVYTYDNGIVHKLPVEVGIYDDSRIQIVSGLTLESQIITTWSPELYEGAPAILKQASEDVQTETTAETTAEAETSAQSETTAQE